MRLTTSSSVKTRRNLWSLTMGNLFVEDDDDNDVLDNTDEQSDLGPSAEVVKCSIEDDPKIVFY